MPTPPHRQDADWELPSLLDNLPSDYARTARAKGLSERVVILRHVLRNSLIPVVTLIALGVPTIFTGAIVTEQIFRINGIGELLMRLTDLFLALPVVPLLLLLIFLFRDTLRRLMGPELGIFWLIVCVIGLLNWMTVARLVRGSFLSLKEKEFVEAATMVGVRRISIMFRHILPNTLGPIIVAATLSVGSAIITESVLSFLGLGFPPDVPTWGRLLYDGQNFLDFAP